MKETLATIEKYFEDETSLLKDWYDEFHKLELYPGEPVSIMPKLEQIKKTFKEWVKKVKTQLINLICVEWDYPKKRQDKKYQNKVELATALADFLILCNWKIPAPIATATLLIKMGLDKICIKYLDGGIC